MSITTTLRTIAPELKTVSDEDLAVWIELAKPFVSEKRFGSLYEQAVAYLTAHKMKVAGLGNTSKFGTVGDAYGVASVSEGEVSVSFSSSKATTLDTDSELLLTPYGVQFLSIKRRRSCSIVVSGEG